MLHRIGRVPAPPRGASTGTRVLAWGSGMFGTLGGSYEPSWGAMREVFGSDACGAPLAEVQSGWSRVLGVTADHRLVSWGWPFDALNPMRMSYLQARAPQIVEWAQRRLGWAGWIGFNRADLEPQVLPLEPYGRIRDVSVGNSFASFSNEDGDVFSMGDALSGQMGLGPATMTPVPQPVDFEGVRIREVHCGYSHTVWIDEFDACWVAGSPHSFALGIGASKTYPDRIPKEDTLGSTPLPIQSEFERYATAKDGSFMGPVATASCGLHYSLFLTTKGQLYGCGRGTSGVLGPRGPDGEHRFAIPFPRHLDWFGGERVRTVRAGTYHAVAVTESGRVFSWGLGPHGECGRPMQEAIRTAGEYVNPADVTKWAKFPPGRIKGLPEGFKVDQVELGLHSTLFISKEGQTILFGKLHKNEAIPNRLRETDFRELAPEATVKDAAIGSGYVVLLAD